MFGANAYFSIHNISHFQTQITSLCVYMFSMPIAGSICMATHPCDILALNPTKYLTPPAYPANDDCQDPNNPVLRWSHASRSCAPLVPAKWEAEALYTSNKSLSPTNGIVGPRLEHALGGKQTIQPHKCIHLQCEDGRLWSEPSKAGI